MEMFIVSSGAVQVVGGPGDSIVFVTLGQVGWDWWRAGHVTPVLTSDWSVSLLRRDRAAGHGRHEQEDRQHQGGDIELHSCQRTFAKFHHAKFVDRSIAHQLSV